MRTIHAVLKFLFMSTLIAGGVILYLHPISDLYAMGVAYLPDSDLARMVVGGAVAVAALIAFLPLLPKRRREKEISFHGTHGEVSIELEPVESTLQRVVGKMPEVKTVSIRVKPLDRPGRVSVMASAVLLKDGDGDARQITARVNNYIQIHTRKILGLEEVEVKLRVRRFVMNMKTVKPEPLLLEAPQPGVAAVRQEVPAPSPVVAVAEESSPVVAVAEEIEVEEVSAGVAPASAAVEEDEPAAEVDWTAGEESGETAEEEERTPGRW